MSKKELMGRIRLFLAALVLVGIQIPAAAQVLGKAETAPAGTEVYSLPSTTLVLKVTAQHESYQLGPYAQYAQKYLGIDVRQESGDFYQIKSIEMVPYVEADPEVSAAVNLQGRAGAANFLSMCSQGLVVLSDNYTGKGAQWRFPSQQNGLEFLSAGVSNIDNITTTLFKTSANADGVMEKVPVMQQQAVQKSLEKKAEETADLIFKLRQKRIEIITGDTDATFSGEAMAATLAEITRMEQEYMGMFTGKSVFDEQQVLFDVVPKAANKKHIYIAFRISDTQGLLHANNMQGRPIVVELAEDGEPIKPTDLAEASLNTKGRVAYRKPVTVVARVKDGQQVLVQTRVPVYQLGKIMSFPIETLMK